MLYDRRGCTQSTQLGCNKTWHYEYYVKLWIYVAQLILVSYIHICRIKLHYQRCCDYDFKPVQIRVGKYVTMKQFSEVNNIICRKLLTRNITAWRSLQLITSKCRVILVSFGRHVLHKRRSRNRMSHLTKLPANILVTTNFSGYVWKHYIYNNLLRIEKTVWNEIFEDMHKGLYTDYSLILIHLVNAKYLNIVLYLIRNHVLVKYGTTNTAQGECLKIFMRISKRGPQWS